MFEILDIKEIILFVVIYILFIPGILLSLPDLTLGSIFGGPEITPLTYLNVTIHAILASIVFIYAKNFMDSYFN